MQFGMPTLIELKSIEPCASLCHELGLDFVELSMDLPEYQADRLDIDELRRIANKYSIYFTIHLEGFLDPCVFNKRVGEAYTQTVLETIEIAKKLGVPTLNMHMSKGDHFTLPDRKVALYAEYKSEYLQKWETFRNRCTAAIGDTGMKISVENCGDYQKCVFMVEGLDVLLQSSVFALCFDIGHNATADFTDEPTIMTRENRLSHMHIHDAKGKSNHLSLGTGELNLVNYLVLAEKHSCRCVLETKTVEGLRQSVNWLKERSYL